MISLKKVMIVVLIICLGIVGYVWKLETEGLDPEYIYGPPVADNMSEQNYTYVGGKIMPKTVLHQEDNEMGCLECHIDEKDFPLTEYAKEKYLR